MLNKQTDNIIFECDLDIDCREDEETVETINGKQVIVKNTGEVFTLDTRANTRILPICNATR